MPDLTKRTIRSLPKLVRAALAPLALAVAPALVPAGSDANLGAQEVDSIPGVRLGLLYETSYTPALAIKPFGGRFGGTGLAPDVEAIVARDLRYSDRFEILDSLPASIVDREGVDYALWDQLGVDWLITGQVEGSGSGYVLVMELHDVVYAEVRERARFSLPQREAEDFRMAVHRASDSVVQWVFDEPGMAASRIAFSVARDSVQELYVVDSDGENLRRVTDHGTLTMNPVWSPDGERMAYVSYRDGRFTLYEMDVRTGEERVIDPGREGQPQTPAYSADGNTLAFALIGGGRTGIYSYDVARDCCLTHVSGGRWEDLSPSFSPDGRRIVFNSNRLGTHTPQIYVMPSGGGDPELLSPYIYGSNSYFTSPEWSPTGDYVAFHGRVERGRYHILVANLEDGASSILRLTSTGNNEDPTWAPDGRHLAFVGERNYGYGLFVVDTATGRERMVIGGMRPRIPDWSPSLGENPGSSERR